MFGRRFESAHLHKKERKMDIAVVGTGYVGLVSGACFAEMGVNVYCVDIDEEKIENLKKGIVPIFEEGLKETVDMNVREGRLFFTTDLAECLDKVEVVFIAVGTPPGKDGAADLEQVFQVAHTIGKNINQYLLVVTKSTVPVGTTHKVQEIINQEMCLRGVDIPFDIASNPEFLKEGTAKKDFMMPDRVVIGVESERAQNIMSSLYRPFLLNNYRVIFMDILSSEMTKYVANAMLATRISFINEVANLCEFTGADINMVRKGVSSDTRIGTKFLYPGCGYGGSCFPKDVKALINTATENGYSMKIMQAVEEVNDVQKGVVYKKLHEAFNGELKGKVIAIWGLSFKPGTDDIREAPSLITINRLLEAGATVRAFDPVAMEPTRAIYGDKVTFCEDIYDASSGADAVALHTEWKQFRIPDWKLLRSTMRGNIFVDGRNIYIKSEVEAEGFSYRCVGLI